MTTESDAPGLLLCTFRLGDQLYGIDVRSVQEVLRSADLTPVPDSAPAIAGQINLRGQIATTIDLRTLLHLEPSDGDREPMHVVVRWSGESVSLLVDRIGDVLQVAHSAFERPPVISDPLVASMIVGLFKLDEELLLVLNVSQMIAATIDHGEDAA